MGDDRKSGIVQVHYKNNILRIRCCGDWDIRNSSEEFEQIAKIKNLEKVILDAGNTQQVTSPFLVFFQKLKNWTATRKIPLEVENFPEGAKKILDLLQEQPSKKVTTAETPGFFYRVGMDVISIAQGICHGILFFIRIVKAFFPTVTGRRKDVLKHAFPFIQETGVDALPIVVLISALVGLIMAFVSVVQLERFGASIYVADLVSLAMTREMGCLMVGVIMAGRTGASFAASIGSMQVNEELDAFRTFGIDTMSYLVMPRVIALALMMPLLCIFADVVGIIGGMLSALPFTHIGVTQYLLQTRKALGMSDIFIGISKSFCFGVIIAGIGCFKGIRCGRNAAAVGQATTAAVVQGITWIIIADAIFAVLCTALGL